MKTDCPPTSRFPVPAGLCWLLALLPGALPAAAQLPASPNDPAAPGETWLFTFQAR